MSTAALCVSRRHLGSAEPPAPTPPPAPPAPACAAGEDAAEWEELLARALYGETVTATESETMSDTCGMGPALTLALARGAAGEGLMPPASTPTPTPTPTCSTVVAAAAARGSAGLPLPTHHECHRRSGGVDEAEAPAPVAEGRGEDPRAQLAWTDVGLVEDFNASGSPPGTEPATASAPPQRRSSRPLLDRAHTGEESTVDLEEADTEHGTDWQRYSPSLDQLAAAAAQDAAEELAAAGGAEMEEDEEEAAAGVADSLSERFWWHLPPRAEASDEGHVLTPLLIPDSDGRVGAHTDDVHTTSAETPAAAAAADPTPPLAPALLEPRMVHANSYLAQQDRLYLSPCTPPEAQAPDPPWPLRRQCVLVVFAANDLRVHDNYTLALAAVRAHAAGAIPVVAVCALDYRTFAQPSLVGGFFRQSPLRARYLLDTVAALREKLEGTYGVPLLLRVGRPEEHVPRLAVELGAVDVFLTTQYAPHERRVHDRILRAVRRGAWVSRHELRGDELAAAADGEAETGEDDGLEGDKIFCVRVQEHTVGGADGVHPYGRHGNPARPTTQPPLSPAETTGTAVPHSVWQTTLVHLDDLPTPVAAMKEGERWYHDDVTTAVIRPTRPYDRQIARLCELPRWEGLLPTAAPPLAQADGGSDSRSGGEAAAEPAVRGALPSLTDLGYPEEGSGRGLSGLLNTEEVIATQSSHPTAGEDAAVAHVQAWLAGGGLTSMLRYGRPRRTNTKLYSQQLARVSPYLSVGALSPRKLYELIRAFALENLRDGFVQMQYREALLRLSRRDYWHWMGLRYGDRLFFSYGPHPDATDGLPDWRHDAKITQKWCVGLTGIPFADAAMRELLATGFVASEGRQALQWLLTRGYGQDWRLGAEWLERCSLDYDPFVCYGNCAYVSELLPDDFGEPVRSIHYLAHHNDQTGIYVKKWLPQLSKVPPVYIHRPHVLTPRMQAMHGVYLGRNYPYPLKLWDGAQHSLSDAQLPAYYAGDSLTRGTMTRAEGKVGGEQGPGYAEAMRCGTSVVEPEELHAAVHVPYVARRPWAQSFLPRETLQAITAGEEDVVAKVLPRRRAPEEARGRWRQVTHESA